MMLLLKIKRRVAHLLGAYSPAASFPSEARVNCRGGGLESRPARRANLGWPRLRGLPLRQQAEEGFAPPTSHQIHDHGRCGDHRAARVFRHQSAEAGKERSTAISMYLGPK